MHDHPMVEGHSKEVFDQVKSLVMEEVSHTPGAIASTIALATSKTFSLNIC
jgi:hypothetical protein